MNALFLKLLNMSAAGSVLILAVVVLRAVLKKAPRWILCLMWALVAIRLVCPVSFASPVSAFQATPSLVSESGEVEVFRPAGGSEKPMLAVDTVQIERPRANTETITEIPGTSYAVTQRSRDAYLPPLVQGYLLGLAAMLLYAVISTLVLRKKVSASVKLGGNVRICDAVPSPFILGIFRPAIYLPSSLSEEEKDFVLAHERAHLRRLDHIWKPLGFLILSLHWFNPLCWLAYVLLCRDIELACDEKVVRELGREARAAYSQTLLNSSAHRVLAACPVAFGETGVKTRVRAVLNYKKPAFWIILLALLGCVVLAVCLMTKPPREPDLSFLNYKNAIPLIGQNDTAPYAVLYPADTNGQQPGVADNKALAQFLAGADWTERPAPASSPEPRGCIEFMIEDDYRIMVYQSERLAAVRFGNDIRYYRIGAGDYEAALAAFIPAPSTVPDRVPEEKTTLDLLSSDPSAFLLGFSDGEVLTAIDSANRPYADSGKSFAEIVSGKVWTVREVHGFPSSDPDRVINILSDDFPQDLGWALRFEESDGEMLCIASRMLSSLDTVWYLDCGENLMDELMAWAIARQDSTHSGPMPRDLTAAEESVVEAVLSDVMWLETPYALSDYTEGQPDGVPELCSLIEIYVRTHRLSMDQMRGLLLGTKGLDGAYAEAYANLLSGLHRYQPLQFDEAYYLTDGSVKAFLPSIFGLNDPDPEATLQNECAFFASLYSMTWRWLRANYGLDYELIAPSISEMELVQLQKAADNTNWLSDNIRPEYPDWSVAVPVEKGGSSKTSGTLTLYYFAQSETEAALVGYSFIENPIPLMTVESGGVSIEPFSVQLNERDWTEAVQRAIDAGNEIPRLTLAGDFDAHFQRSVRKGRLQIYGEDFRPLITDAYGDTALLWLAPGSYYAVIDVYGPWASRVSGDAYRCVFRLYVPAGRPAPFEPTEARDLTEARLHWRGRDYVITDADALAQLEGWLRNAEAMPGGAACPFSSVLTLTRADGSCFSCCPAEDSCSVVYADGTYYQYAHDNEDFWTLFGIEQWW